MHAHLHIQQVERNKLHSCACQVLVGLAADSVDSPPLVLARVQLLQQRAALRGFQPHPHLVHCMLRIATTGNTATTGYNQVADEQVGPSAGCCCKSFSNKQQTATRT